MLLDRSLKVRVHLRIPGMRRRTKQRDTLRNDSRATGEQGFDEASPCDNLEKLDCLLESHRTTAGTKEANYHASSAPYVTCFSDWLSQDSLRRLGGYGGPKIGWGYIKEKGWLGQYCDLSLIAPLPLPKSMIWTSVSLPQTPIGLTR